MRFEEVLELTKNVYALLGEKEKETLYNYASKVPDNGIIVDIGTAAGGSAFIMALASPPNVKVWTIDPVENENFIFNRKELDLEEKIIFVKKESLKAFETWGDTSIDMLFIDGVHSHRGVKSDFETFGSQVKTGGIVIFHDVILYSDIGVYISEIIKQGLVKKLELVEDKFNGEVLTGLFVGEKL